MKMYINLFRPFNYKLIFLYKKYLCIYYLIFMCDKYSINNEKEKVSLQRVGRQQFIQFLFFKLDRVRSEKKKIHR